LVLFNTVFQFYYFIFFFFFFFVSGVLKNYAKAANETVRIANLLQHEFVGVDFGNLFCDVCFFEFNFEILC
jgi:hypothetical protein